MQALLKDVVTLSDNTYHNAFTDCCFWHGKYYVAYRRAMSHNIVPPGDIVVCTLPIPRAWEYHYDDAEVFHHPIGDLRDPKFLATPDVLYLICGVYLPDQGIHHDRPPVLMPTSVENILETHITYTTDGTTWSPLFPILRAQYWGWSAVALASSYALASYHIGVAGDTTSIALWTSVSPLGLALRGLIYDAGSTEHTGKTLRYPHSETSEPVLWYDAETALLGCCIRTEDVMEIGYGRWPYNPSEWRWHCTKKHIHPSAILQTDHGLLLAGRDVEKYRTGMLDAGGKHPLSAPKPTTCLYHLDGRTITKLLTLPSGGDTGYAGLAHGPEPDTMLVSYYTSHEVPIELPGAQVSLATVRLAP